MGVCWTEEQKRVIELRDCNILVSAAAGSGKTAVLVERILSMLTDPSHPVDIDRLLIVTFTNAAAGEMRDRIRVAVESRLEDENLPIEIQDHLQRQTALLQTAQITTIHSFCQYVIRNHFHTIDLDPSFRIADEGEQKMMKNEVMEKMLDYRYAEGRQSFLSMTEQFSAGRDDREIPELILQLYHFSMSFPWPEKWLLECKKAYDLADEEAFATADWMGLLMGLVRLFLEDAGEQVEEALNLALFEEDGPYMYREALESDKTLIDNLSAAENYLEFAEVIRTRRSWARLSSKKDEKVSQEKRDRVKELRDQYKARIDELQEDYFYAPASQLLQEMQKSAPAMGELLDLAVVFSREYAEEKRKKNLMDFNDLEHFALEILLKEENGVPVPTEVAREFADCYEEIMIDEYQDSNLVQEFILTSVSRRPKENNLFMVGDVKQSIYRFRLARPELFMEKFQTYSQVGEDHVRVDLHKNFRSRSQVLTFVNYIFGQIMEEHLGKVQYDQEAALYPGAVFPSTVKETFYDTEVMLVHTDRKDFEGEKDLTVTETNRELEARAVGERILRIVGVEQVWDKGEGGYRPAGYGDIVILLRTINGWGDVFARVLGEMGIPARTGSRTGYFSTTEIQTVLSFLKIIDNPRQDLPMTAVLYSPIVGVSKEELADIRSSSPTLPFYEGCKRRESLKGFFAMLEDFRRMAAYMPIHELLWEILDRTGYGAYAGAMPGGAQRRANLDMLVEKAMAYEQGSYHGLYNFIRYIENLHKYDVDFGEAGIGEGEKDIVEIMSIHKSKGLEFPIVFVSGMGKKMNQSDSRSPLVLHSDLGVGCDCTDLVFRTRSNTLLKKLMKNMILYENLGEEQRILYVAMTRAKEKLILTGTVSGIEEKKWRSISQSKEKELSFTSRASASNYWDWIMPALMRNKASEEAGLSGHRASLLLWEEEIFCQISHVSIWDLIENETERQINYGITAEELRNMPVNLQTESAKKLTESLCYEYPYSESLSVPNKISVSELKKLSQGELAEEGAVLYEERVPVPLIPDFLKAEEEVSGASRGTIYHKVMECLDFSENIENTQNSVRVKAEIQGMVEKGQLTREEANLVEIGKIGKFLENPLAHRMQQAAERGQLYREQQFVLEMDASEVGESFAGGQPILIQGIIDAFFVEEGRIVLVDYKTDSVKMKDASSLYKKYKVQLEYYEKALERLLGLPVCEKLIYSFSLNRVISGEERE